jgi:hypothetical protein
LHGAECLQPQWLEVRREFFFGDLWHDNKVRAVF